MNGRYVKRKSVQAVKLIWYCWMLIPPLKTEKSIATASYINIDTPFFFYGVCPHDTKSVGGGCTCIEQHLPTLVRHNPASVQCRVVGRLSQPDRTIANRKPPNVIMVGFWFIIHFRTRAVFLLSSSNDWQKPRTHGTHTQRTTTCAEFVFFFLIFMLHNRVDTTSVECQRCGSFIESKINCHSNKSGKFFFPPIFIFIFLLLSRICKRSDFKTFDRRTHSHSHTYTQKKKQATHSIDGILFSDAFMQIHVVVDRVEYGYAAEIARALYVNTHAWFNESNDAEKWVIGCAEKNCRTVVGRYRIGRMHLHIIVVFFFFHFCRCCGPAGRWRETATATTVATSTTLDTHFPQATPHAVV